MAWTYSDWVSQSTPAAQLTRLNLHIKEVSDAVGNEIGSDGKSRSSAATERMLDRLHKHRERLQAIAGGVGGGVSLARFSGRREP
jgi:hypothetical protein